LYRKGPNTYARLQDGSWGVRCTSERIVCGTKTRVTVTKKNGDTEQHDIECIRHGRDREGYHWALCRIVDVDRGHGCEINERGFTRHG